MLKKTVAIIVVCHAAYAHFAQDCIKAIESQTLPFTKKVFVWDGEGFPFSSKFADGWICRLDKFGSPNKARNAGFQDVLDCEWVVFWDADNIMPPNYHAQAYGTVMAAPSSVGVCYPDVQRVDARGNQLHRHKMPDWTHRRSQSRSICDSASFWRVEAVCEVGGFEATQIRHDDYTLALRIFRAGWKGQKLPACFNHLSHSQNRSTLNSITDSLFIAYHFAFVTLWSGGDLNTSLRVLQWLDTAEIPPSSMLYWVDNSGGKMRSLLHYYSERLRDRFLGVTIIDGGEPYRMDKGEDYKHPARHKHVAYLYNMILPMIREEIVVTIEDDVIAPENGVRRLLGLMSPHSPVAVSSGVYRSRPSPVHACCSLDFNRWHNVPLINKMPKEPFEVGMTGMGFALIANWALQECLPVFCELTEDGRLMGWDGNLGIALRERGYKLLVHPGVYCQHLCKSVMEWEWRHPKPYYPETCMIY